MGVPCLLVAIDFLPGVSTLHLIYLRLLGYPESRQYKSKCCMRVGKQIHLLYADNTKVPRFACMRDRILDSHPEHERQATRKQQAVWGAAGVDGWLQRKVGMI